MNTDKKITAQFEEIEDDIGRFTSSLFKISSVAFSIIAGVAFIGTTIYHKKKKDGLSSNEGKKTLIIK